MITRSLAALAIGAAVALTAGCGSSGGTGASDELTPTKITSVSFQLRPVLTEVAAKDKDCEMKVVPTPSLIEPIDEICNVDATTLYSLGKAVVGQNQVKKVALVDDQSGSPATAVQLSLDTPGTAAFATLSDAASKKASPKNEIGFVVNGQVVSSPQVQDGAITSGEVQVTFADATAAQEFYDSWPEAMRTASN